MTREEANKVLSDIDHAYRNFTQEEYVALDVAIKALEQQPCDDCVSRQAVLDALDKSKYSNEFCEEHHIDWSINLGMAHIVVNELKPVTLQPCGDAISRQAVLEVIRKCHCEEWVKADIGAPIEALPSVSPQPKMGRWVKHDTGHSKYYYDCSLCGCVAPCTEFCDCFVWKLSAYCPDCGAKMIDTQEGMIRMSKCRYDLSADCNSHDCLLDCLPCVLDKIRAKIEFQRKEVSDKKSEDVELQNYYFGLNDGLKDARDVIDKYKAILTGAESEDKV